MKKISIVLLVSALFLTGCQRDNYLAEKEYFKAAKILQQVTPGQFKADPIKSLEPAITAYQKVVDKYPLTTKAAESLFAISGLRLKQKKFEEARTPLNKVIQNFSGRSEWASDARFQIAQTYEIEGLWPKAEKAYWEVAEYSPLQRKGLYAPLYVLLYYKQINVVEKATEAYQKAVEHYEHTLNQVGPIEASIGVKNSLALTHVAQDNWQKARTIWRSIAKDFPENNFAPLALLAAADISQRKADFIEAFKDYDLFFQKYGRHSMAAQTSIRVGMLHESRKEFADARTWFEKAIAQYFKRDQSEIADIKLLIGRSFQDEGKWEQAEAVYQDLEKNYPETPGALQVAFLRAVHYNKEGNSAKANEVLDKAITNFNKIISERPSSKLSAYAKQFLFTAYTEKKDWHQLLANVERELQAETDKGRRGRWVFLKALITENRLQERKQAISLYQNFLKEYPEHPLTQVATGRLQGLLSKAGTDKVA